MTLAAQLVAVLEINMVAIRQLQFIPVLRVVAVETPALFRSMLELDVRVLILEHSSLGVGLHTRVTVGTREDAFQKGGRGTGNSLAYSLRRDPDKKATMAIQRLNIKIRRTDSLFNADETADSICTRCTKSNFASSAVRPHPPPQHEVYYFLDIERHNVLYYRTMYESIGIFGYFFLVQEPAPEATFTLAKQRPWGRSPWPFS
jgi:hypothetical protein